VIRGIRGAAQCADGRPETIAATAAELLQKVRQANHFDPQDIAAVFFTVTPDLNQAFASQAARRLQWTHVPLIDVAQAPVDGDLPRLLRVLILWNTDLPQDAIQHVYLGAAARLRPDLAGIVSPLGGDRS